MMDGRLLYKHNYAHGTHIIFIKPAYYYSRSIYYANRPYLRRNNLDGTKEQIIYSENENVFNYLGMDLDMRFVCHRESYRANLGHWCGRLYKG
jgi:hypothetical protein